MLQKTSSLTQLNRTLSAFLAGFKLQRRQAAEANWLTRFKAKQMQISVEGGEGAILLFLFPVQLCVCVWLGKQKSWLACHSVSQSIRASCSQSKAKKRNEIEINAWPAALGRIQSPPPPTPAGQQQTPADPAQTRADQPRAAQAGSCNSLLIFMAHFAILRLSFTKLVRLQL